MSLVFGVVTGKVTDVKDPLGIGRVRVNFPWLPGENQSYWAPVATMMAGKQRGSWFMPELGDDVLVAFEQGHVDHPYVLGFLWNGKDKPPRTDTTIRVIESVNGHQIEIYDQVGGPGKGYVRIQDAHGNVIELGDSYISITGVGAVTIDAPSILINNRPVNLVGGPI